MIAGTRYRRPSFLLVLQLLLLGLQWISHAFVIVSREQFTTRRWTTEAKVTTLPNPVDISPESPLISPLSLTFEELQQSLGGGVGRYRAVWDCFRIGVDPQLFYDPSVEETEIDASVTQQYEAIPTLTREELKLRLPPKRRNQGLGVPALRSLSQVGGSSSRGIEHSIGTLTHISRAADGTTKLLVTMAADGLEVETVIIPWEETKRSTLCISSQVGCRMGCTFCATGRMGKLRSLSTDEILAQVYLSRKVCRILEIHPVDGVVFMGMGEPADNADAVVRAAEALTDSERFGMAKTKVTISTVGPTPQAFAVLGKAPAALAWSVHSSRDEVRRKLVPTTKYTMEELRRGYLDALLERPVKLRTTMIEIALISGVNDSPADADHLGDFVKQMVDEVPGMKPMINLIPFNDIGHPTYRKPTVEQVWAFQDRLMSKGIKAFIRTTRGDDESAACGQLATKKIKGII